MSVGLLGELPGDWISRRHTSTQSIFGESRALGTETNGQSVDAQLKTQ